MTGEQSAQPDEVLAVMVRTREGEMYMIPKDVLDTFRLSHEERTEVEATLPAGDDDVEGYQFWDAWALSYSLQRHMVGYTTTAAIMNNVLKRVSSTSATITGNIK